MTLFRKFIIFNLIAALGLALGLSLWAQQPITAKDQPPIEFTIEQGSSVRHASRQIASAGVPVAPVLLEFLVRISGKAASLKAGTYELKPGTSPSALIEQLVRGQFVQESITIIEGWTFKQMRMAIEQHQGLRHDSAGLSEQELLAKVAPGYKVAEGLFYPDTYVFAKGASDLQVYRQAHQAMLKRLNAAWAKRNPAVTYRNPYEALIMASIIEKETGQRSERSMIAAVFVNRLKMDMLLQTDPTVIYGMGDRFDGNIRKRDLLTDTPYNTYTRKGLPPTPIALPGGESLEAALNPAKTDALYFVARGDGTSHFSSNLRDHNNAVAKYQRGGRGVLQ